MVEAPWAGRAGCGTRRRAAAQVDAFTTHLFRGNPAAVVVMDKWLPDELLQAIAAENNLAETAFVIPGSDPRPLQWFTPAVEVDLCGHATLATAHVLLRHHLPKLGSLTFTTKSGNLTVSRDHDLLSMDFPSRPGRPIAVSDALIAALGSKPEEAFLARDLLAVLESEAEVRGLKPHFERLTGSSHCTLVPYWARRLGKTSLTARQLSARGGELRCRLKGDRVIIAGAAVEYLRGEITVGG